ncbi:MAG: UvrD-helicase domain-containing protein [Spirochaetia bacterium]
MDNAGGSDYLSVLNEGQRKAVYHEGAPLLILAGAGSGKTRVITTKIAYMVEHRGINPSSILAVTFTNKAAAEMHERVREMVPDAREAMVRTFHSFGAWLLRRNSHLLGMQSTFSIYDDEDSLSLLHSIYDTFKRRELLPFSRAISRAKDYCLSPEDDLTEISRDNRFPDMYAAYEKRLREIGNADFGDLIKRPVELLRDNDEVRRRIQSRFRVVLVDEYQDSNVAQYTLLKLLFGEGTYLCVVGDDDQSIYRFRGAEIRNILTFPDEFEGTDIIRLERNYRSTDTILAIAGEVVSRNRGRLGKTLWTELGEGKEAHLAFIKDQEEEAKYCARLLEDGNLEGTAILYRTNAQSRSLETLFLRRGIPYKIVGSLRFYEREEVKDAVALLHFLMNTKDEVSFRRVVNKPARGLGAKSISALVEASSGTGGDLYRGAVQKLDSFSGKSRKGLEEFVHFIGKLYTELEGAELGAFLRSAFRSSNLLAYHKDQDNISGTRKVENLEELAGAASKYPRGREGLEGFLEDLELDRARIAGKDPAQEPGVTLITMHNTKGLEFDRVIITGMEEGIFPSRPDEKEDEIEEERRILYVAITRAKRELYFTSCRRRTIWGKTVLQQPSRFIQEFPEEHLKVEGDHYAGSTRRYAPEEDYPYQNYPQQGLPDKHSSEEGSPWRRGQRVYHDEYGPGIIWSVDGEGKATVLHVQFETGQKGTFMPAYNHIETIGEEFI